MRARLDTASLIKSACDACSACKLFASAFIVLAVHTVADTVSLRCMNAAVYVICKLAQRHLCAVCKPSESLLQVRLGLPATQWITVYNAHRPMKQRYHYNVANMRVEQHVVKGNDDGLFITSVACCQVRRCACAALLFEV